MEATGPLSSCIYMIDKLDRIISVSDNWSLFARENEAGESCHPDAILNRPLWDFIHGIEISHFYEILLKNIRAKNKTVKVPFRCDAPEKRRYLELTITPVPEESLEFTSSLIREELRDRVDMLDSGGTRSDRLITICCMCMKVALAEDRWVEVESALVSLKLFEEDPLPQISHGLCAECFELGMADFEKSCP